MLIRPGLALLMVIALAGCSDGRHAEARPGRSLVIPLPSPSPTGRARPARPGAVCGQVTTVTGGQATVVVVRGRTTCDEAVRVFQKYNDPTTPAEGAAGLAVIGRWTCETRRTVTTCTAGAATIRARA